MTTAAIGSHSCVQEIRAAFMYIYLFHRKRSHKTADNKLPANEAGSTVIRKRLQSKSACSISRPGSAGPPCSALAPPVLRLDFSRMDGPTLAYSVQHRDKSLVIAPCRRELREEELEGRVAYQAPQKRIRLDRRGHDRRRQGKRRLVVLLVVLLLLR